MKLFAMLFFYLSLLILVVFDNNTSKQNISKQKIKKEISFKKVLEGELAYLEKINKTLF